MLVHNVHTHERDREEFLIDSLKPRNLCRKALERLDDDEEEGQMWEEEPLNQRTLLGGMILALLHCFFMFVPPLPQGITLLYSLRFCRLKQNTLQDST